MKASLVSDIPDNPHSLHEVLGIIVGVDSSALFQAVYEHLIEHEAKYRAMLDKLRFSSRHGVEEPYTDMYQFLLMHAHGLAKPLNDLILQAAATIYNKTIATFAYGGLLRMFQPQALIALLTGGTAVAETSVPREQDSYRARAALFVSALAPDALQSKGIVALLGGKSKFCLLIQPHAV